MAEELERGDETLRAIEKPHVRVNILSGGDRANSVVSGECGVCDECS